MFNLDATDKLEAIVASDTNKVMFTVSGHDATSGVISSQGYVTTSNTEIYDAVGATRIYSFTAYNSHTSAITITLNKDPGDVGTLWTFFKVSLGAGYSLHFDGQRCSVLDASGNIQTIQNNVSLTDGVSGILPISNGGSGTTGKNIIQGWCQYTSIGAGAINDSLNVASIAEVGDGDWYVYWDTNFADANYACVVSTREPDINGSCIAAAASARCRTKNNSGTATDAITYVIAVGLQ